MAYFGNTMFGHHMQYAGQYNSGFGSAGFGQHDHSPFANKKGHGGSFGTSNLDPNGMMHHAHTGYHHYGHTGILRQNSLLGEMTQSKSERAKGAKPWAFSSFSYPITQHDSSCLSTLYEKPLEKPKPKHAMLMRQQSFSMADSLERKRAPSFSSDPGRMRSRTVSTSSMPERRSKFMRSLSIADDLTEPVNMDIAGPFLRRQQSLDIEKARRKSLKKPLLSMNIPRFSKHRRSSKTKDAINKQTDPETTSLEVPRSRCDSVESSRSSNVSLKLGEITPENRSVSKTPSKDELAQEKLILSLMNPVVPKDNMFEHNLLPNDMNSQRNSMQSDVSPVESPTMVRRRVYKLRSTEQDNVSIKSNNSGQYAPRSTRSYTDSRSSKTSKSPTRGSALLTQEPVLATVHQKHTDQFERKPDMYTDPADSDTSDVYYDCANQSQKNSPLPMRNENSTSIKSKTRLIKKPRNTCSSSTCTDGEDTTSTCDTSPRASFRDIQQKYHPEYPNKAATETYLSGTDDLMSTDIHENDTLRIRDRGFKPNYTQNSVKEKPNIKQLATNESFSVKIHVADESEHNIPNPELIVPVYAPVLKVETDNNNTESGTAESSESGYATSHIPTSPKNYDHIKVSQFVNSLPIYLDMNEKRSESYHGNSVANGSDTESDIEEDHHVAYSLPDLDLTNINCHSGSDTESIKTEDSMSKLEVMKILDSPSEVRERVINRIKEKLNVKGQARLEDSKTQFNTELRKGSNASETELLKLMKPDTDNVKDDGSVKSDKDKNVEVHSVVVSQNSPNNDSAETRLLKQQGKSKSSFAASVIDRISFRREYSSIYQSRSTNCVDGLLHFLNLLLFLSSAGVVGIGIWLQLKDFNINDITVILGNNLLQVIIYVAISGAGVALLATFCLCCGLKQEKSGLGFYAFVLVAVVIALATAAVLSTIFSDKLRGIEFKFNFKDRLVTKYGVAGKDSENTFFTDAWNNMQSEFECCGGEGNENDTESWALYRKSDWFLQHANKGMVFVPESCCKKNKNIAICQGGDHDLLGPPRYAPPRNKYYPDTNPNLNANGCYPSLYIYLTKMSMYIAIVCGSLAVLYFLMVMLTWVFCFKKSQDYVNDSFFDDSYYDIEEHDEVFNNEDDRVLKLRLNKERDTNPMVEETTFINTPVTSPSKVPALIDNGNLKLRDMGNRSNSGNNAMDHNDSSNEKSDQSETDDDTASSGSTPRDVAIERRNLWLSSAAATGYLLSVAIEEEDSNFEDSDEHDSRISANV